MAAAVQLLTIVPVPAAKPDERSVRWAVAWYPLVGLLIAGPACAVWIAAEPLGTVLQGALSLAVWAWMTGFLHIDGLCDTADAVLARKTVKQRLRILHDTKTGAFALAATAITLIVKFAALSELWTATGILVVPVVARTWVTVQMIAFRLYEGSKLGAGNLPSKAAVATALLLGGSATAAVAWIQEIAMLDVLMIHGLTFGLFFALGFWFSRRLGGLGGDPWGASIELAEAILLVAFVGAAV